MVPVTPSLSVHRVELTGHPAALKLPDICANCGVHSNGHVRQGRVCVREYRELPNEYFTVWMFVPLCLTCISVHERERPPLSFARRALLMFRTGEVLGGLGPAAVAVFLLYVGIPQFNRNDPVFAAIWGGLAAIFAFFACWGFRHAWAESERFTVQEPSSVTASLDFSDDISSTFEPRRHVYTMSNAKFAAAFIEANRGRIWDPQGKQAHVAKRRMKIAMIVFALVAFLVFVHAVLEELGLLPWLAR